MTLQQHHGRLQYYFFLMFFKQSLSDYHNNQLAQPLQAPRRFTIKNIKMDNASMMYWISKAIASKVIEPAGQIAGVGTGQSQSHCRWHDIISWRDHWCVELPTANMIWYCSQGLSDYSADSSHLLIWRWLLRFTSAHRKQDAIILDKELQAAGFTNFSSSSSQCITLSPSLQMLTM